MENCLRRIASFIPRDDRIKLFRLLYDKCNSNATATARLIGINTRQIYFYLPDKEGKIRNFPNDKTTYLILKAMFKKDPESAVKILWDLSTELNNLLKALDVNGGK